MLHVIILASIGVLAIFICLVVLADKNNRYTNGRYFVSFSFCYALWSYSVMGFYLLKDSHTMRLAAQLFVYVMTLAFALAFYFVYRVFASKIAYARKVCIFCGICLAATLFTNYFVNISVYFEHGTAYYSFEPNPAFLCFTFFRYLTVISAILLAAVIFHGTAVKREKATACTIALIAFIGGILITLDLLFDCPLFFLVAAMIPILALFFYVCFANNISDMKMVNLSKYLYSSISTPIVLLSTSGRLALCNLPASSFLNRKEEELLGAPIDAIFSFDVPFETALLAKKDEIVSRLLTAKCQLNNAICDINITSIYDRYGELLYSILLISDVSERIATLNQLEQAKFAAEQANEAKSKFLAKMSHEIRTPMNAIMGMSEILLREALSGSARDLVTEIKHAGGNLLSIINDILDLTKIESGKLELIPAKYALSSLVNDVISIIRVRVMDKPLLFVVNIDSFLPYHLIGDEVRIRQILLNLLNNAVKYTDQGFISLSISCASQTETTLYLDISVTDSGRGIKEEDLDSLFGEFVQADITKNKGVEGTGLGLAIVNRLCRAMGGTVTVSSTYGEGSTFHLNLLQEYKQYERFAEVENPLAKNVLLYEPRKAIADSILTALRNLEVACTLVTEHSIFLDALKSSRYPYLLIAASLAEELYDEIKVYDASLKVVLLAEYGKAASSRFRTVLAFPIHTILLAQILNETETGILYSNIEATGIPFRAPSVKVLIVDDIATNLRVAEGLLLPYGMQIDVCESGGQAVALTQSAEYDLVFMDHMMPGMSGIDAVSAIRKAGEQLPRLLTLPIIALTANAVSGIREMFLENGFHDFLAKPIEMYKLNDILEKWIPDEKKEQGAKTEEIFSADPPTIEGLDVKKGIALTGGTLAQYLKVLATFRQDVLLKMPEIETCLKKQDFSRYATEVHALKSALANIGSKPLSDIARGLEDAAKTNHLTYLKDNTPDFLANLSRLLEHISKVLDQEATLKIKENPTIISDALLTAELLNLKKALEEMNTAEADTILNRLEQGCTESLSAILGQIEQDILLFEFEEAVTLIDEVLAK